MIRPGIIGVGSESMVRSDGIDDLEEMGVLVFVSGVSKRLEVDDDDDDDTVGASTRRWMDESSKVECEAWKVGSPGCIVQSTSASGVVQPVGS